MLRGVLSAIAASSFMLAGPALAADRAIIVMDASGSMWGQIDGKTKIEIARETIGSVLPSIPGDTELGLIAYGHREKGQCSDIEEIVPPGAGTRDRIIAAVDGLNPKGKTPLTDAVRMAAEALKYTEDKATVILVTDGIETCEADPCAAATELEKAGVDFTVHVVGFGLSEDEGQKVACLAENTGGRYLPASDAAELAEALTETVAAAPPPPPEPKPQPAAVEHNLVMTAALTEGLPLTERQAFIEVFPLDENGKPGKRVDYTYANKPWPRSYEPGRYLVKAKADLAVAETIVDLTATETVEREIVLNAGIVNIGVAPAEDAEPDKSGFVELRAGDEREISYGPFTQVVPAGKVEATGKIGKAEVHETLDVAAGQTLDKKLVALAGRLTTRAVYVEGGPEVEGNQIRFDVVSAKKALDGSQKKWDGTYGAGDFMLPPGDYIVKARLDAAIAEAPVTVESGALSELVVNLDAGVLHIAAPGAYRIDVFEAKKDLQGNRKRVDGAYGEEYQITLNPGEYLVVATMGDSVQGEKKELTATVTAAERMEVEVK